jgi:sugar phosphate permease
MQTGFRGWWVVAVAFLGQFAALGFGIIIFPLFAQPIQEEFSISMLQFNSVMAPFSIVMTLSGPVVGPMLDRRSIRGIMAGGALLMAASLGLMSLAKTPLQLGLVFGIGPALCVTLLGPLPAMTVVTRWFERQRGRAMGIVSLGPSVAGLVLTQLCGGLIEQLGWRATLRWFSLGTLLLVPLIWAVIRNRPEDVGQVPDGDASRPAQAAHASGPPAWSMRSLVSTRAFWVIALALGVIFGFLQAWQANVGKFTHDLGYGMQEAVRMVQAGALLGIPGPLLFGWLAERRDARTLVWIAMLLLIVAFSVFRAQPGLPVLLGASGLVGGAAGGVTPLYAALLARTFGSASFGSAMGLAGVVMMPFTAVAPPLLGQLRDASGNYDSGLLAVIAAFALGSAVLALLPGRAPVATPVAPAS